ncbi:hypothetical protein J7E50_19595 [Pedobacter sp. ISL-68]|uniref:hypothetical protein n=1 Tax=unclassified Pedobacter TaxID=2628915 RepID=UPI001BE50BCF|nr:MULTISPECIES: hypothetical protein [unclassified Pedobacter]MBT2564679.1 hypothetical protein [Pedobacter sp. ISL-64]MBT2592432.1 hypothetical protein [Pedobacter sp. ISL-68]
MQSAYPFEWIDLIVTVTLNPENTKLSALTNEQIQLVISQVPKEKTKLQSLLKSEIFNTSKEKQIELLVKQYHSALIVLLDQAFDNQKKYTSKKELLRDVYSMIIYALDELLSFVEIRFSAYLSLDERVPITYLTVSKKELKVKSTKLKVTLLKDLDDKRLGEIIICTLLSFSNSIANDYTITFKELLYYKELVKELEMLNEPEPADVNTAINELLIYMNFNSRAYLTYYSERIANRINKATDVREKMDLLLLHFKEFKQMHRKTGIVLYPNHANLEIALSNWFTQELLYLEKTLHLNILPLNKKQENLKSKNNIEGAPLKVLCILSSDQTGLILRAADELRILVAKSMNEVFKTIVPHLSTPYKDDLSYDGMRSKSYVAEDRDKKIAIETLEKIIKKIKDY